MNPVTVDEVHQVRGRDTKILSKYQLAKELPLFINAELVELGERRPFYHEFIGEHSSSAVVDELRSSTQLSVVGHFVCSSGDLLLLQRLWSHVGTFSHYQETFQNFVWDPESLSVSSDRECFLDLGLGYCGAYISSITAV